MFDVGRSETATHADRRQAAIPIKCENLNRKTETIPESLNQSPLPPFTQSAIVVTGSLRMQHLGRAFKLGHEVVAVELGRHLHRQDVIGFVRGPLLGAPS